VEEYVAQEPRYQDDRRWRNQNLLHHTRFFYQQYLAFSIDEFRIEQVPNNL